MSDIISSKKDSRKYNYGICLLKIFMCFEVVCCHFWNSNSIPAYLKPFSIFRTSAVPVFVCITFVFSYKIIEKSNADLLTKRLKRLYVPHVIWAIIYWLIYSMLAVWRNLGDISFSELVWQIGTGHSEKLNPSMWYQIDIIIILLLLYISHKKLSEKMYKRLLYGCLLGSYFFQYSMINYELFEDLRYELMYPLGRILEILPVAIVGLLLVKEDVLTKFKKKWKYSLPITLIALMLSYCIWKVDRVICRQGFGYTGFGFLGIAVSLVVFSYALPFENLPEIIKNIIVICSRYTFGIYCMHRLVAKLITITLDLNQNQISSFAFCVCVYSVSFFIAILISRIDWKWAKGIVE